MQHVFGRGLYLSIRFYLYSECSIRPSVMTVLRSKLYVYFE